MALKCPFSLSVASVGILCKTGKRHWESGWVTKGWVALDPGSKDWGGPLSKAMHCGAGDPWCLLGNSPRSLRSRSDHGRVRWLVEGGESSFQDVGTGLSFLDLGAGELEDFSE